jgi:hypothetical protein
MLEMQREPTASVTTTPETEEQEQASEQSFEPAPPYHDVFDGPSPPDAEAPRRRFLPKGFGGRGPKGPVRPDGEESGSFDLRNNWQVLAGSILIPLGLVFILLGWYGAAHARVVQQQIPYMVSGSFIGLGCMVVGGLLYWGHWLYRLYDQNDLHHEEQLKALHEIARALGGGPVPASGASGSSAETGPAAAEAGAYFATVYGTVYHRADCPVIAHHPADLRVLGAGGTAGLSACQICLPG